MTLEQDIARIAEQEEALVFERFGPDEAWQLGSLLRDMARERGLPVAIGIRLHSMPLFYVALPGSLPDNENWVRRKSNVVLRFFKSSYGLGLKLATQEATLEAKFSLPAADYATHGGSFPITVAGAGCIGAVTVSGLPQRDDHNLVFEALLVMMGKSAAGLQLE
jgi:uncharacterized protein (UPF0303 family)